MLCEICEGGKAVSTTSGWNAMVCLSVAGLVFVGGDGNEVDAGEATLKRFETAG